MILDPTAVAMLALACLAVWLIVSFLIGVEHK